MNYAVEMGSGAMIYIPSSIKTGSPIQKLIGGYMESRLKSVSRGRSFQRKRKAHAGAVLDTYFYEIDYKFLWLVY
jgi:hypothetical protein